MLTAVLWLSSTAQAQVLYGSLTGSVTDPQGATVPGAMVTAANTGTGLAKESATDERGGYRFNDLQPGVYKVTISAPGFASLVQDGVGIEANRLRRLDAVLKVAKSAKR
jgi:hypothetical protein